MPVLGRREVAWVLELSEDEVLNMQKRGERAHVRGVDDEQVMAAGGLPVAIVNGRRCMSPSMLAAHPDVAGRQMREDALAALVEGRIRAPRASSLRVRSRRLVENVASFS